MRRVIGTMFVLLIPFALILIFRKQINHLYDKSAGVTGACTLIASIYVAIGEYYYLKSERFYLWVQRQILRWRRVHTYWRFTVRYAGVEGLMRDGRSQMPELQQRISSALAASFPSKPLDESTLTNSISVTVDDNDRFDFSVDFDDNEVVLHTSKMRVPSHMYWSFLDTLVELLDRVEKAIAPRDTQYRLELTFEENKNPYFGFFVRHVPKKLLTYFKCTFQSSINAECRVEATRDAIFLDCPSKTTLSAVARGYLSLSERLITSGDAR